MVWLWLAAAGLLTAGVTKASSTAKASQTTEQPTVVVVVGAPGEPEFTTQFEAWAADWKLAAEKAKAKWVAVGLDPGAQTADREILRGILTEESKDTTNNLWLVLIGHGTFDRSEAKFNLRGPDLAATELKEWLKEVRRPLSIINCASASGPFLNLLSSQGRIVITATRSGAEQNFARFGLFFAQAIGGTEADLDKDGQTSLLEAYLMAARKAADFYDQEGRLATEHPLLDDNGDAMGTPPDWFRGVRAIKKAKEGTEPDGWRAHQWHLVRSAWEATLPAALRTRRDQLELEIARLRESKKSMNETNYYDHLEALLLDLAKLYQNLNPAEPVQEPKPSAQ